MSTKDLVYIALFAAVIAAMALIPPIPVPVIPVPITAQTLGVMLAGSILGGGRGMLAVLLFLALVAVGLPLLPGGRGGMSVFAGPTAGFLLSWPLGALVVGLLMERFWGKVDVVLAFIFNVIGGIFVIYAFGIGWLVVMVGADPLAALTGSAAFVPGDLIKAGVAAFVAVTVKRSYPIIVKRARAS
ncbi:MAG TPA: biotin transporter BioY [Saliniramus sp.]|nr:biotin transporter BioY [Saliniramus sp.]